MIFSYHPLHFIATMYSTWRCIVADRPTPDRKREWITIAEAAAIKGHDTATIRQAAMRGSFVAEKAMNTWLIYKPDYEWWLKYKALGPRE